MTAGKRLFDILCAATALVLLSPVFLLIACVIRLDDGGPVLYRQRRVGRDGAAFDLWKFRTMSTGAAARGPLVTSAGDVRVTRVGRWLRERRLDELPQLYNVLRGEMSIVGPRPEVPRYVALYTAEQRRSLQWVPGLTDPATLCFRDEGRILAASPDPELTYLTEIMPVRLRLATDYAERANLVSDARVIVRTAWCLIAPGAAPVPGAPVSNGNA